MGLRGFGTNLFTFGKKLDQNSAVFPGFLRASAKKLKWDCEDLHPDYYHPKVVS